MSGATGAKNEKHALWLVAMIYDGRWFQGCPAYWLDQKSNNMIPMLVSNLSTTSKQVV